MRLGYVVAGLTMLAYLASGLYIVRGNEQALIRRCGRADRQLVGSGLHYALPWPWARIDRINVNEIRTLSIGLAASEELDPNDFLKPASSSRWAEFLTGDKNVLHLQVQVQYRVADPYRYVLQGEQPDRQLRFLAESVVTDLVSRSGVDYVHPLGLNELRRKLTEQARQLAEKHQVGVEIEEVAIADVRPPALVKQAFLDVSNARAEKERMLSEALAEAERQVAQAEAQARQELDRAETERTRQVQAARGEAERFLALLQPLERFAETGLTSYAQARRLALERMYWSTLEEVLPRIARNIFIDPQQPVDLTLPRVPAEAR